MRVCGDLVNTRCKVSEIETFVHNDFCARVRRESLTRVAWNEEGDWSLLFYEITGFYLLLISS
jgi:hypothetical protein